MLGKFWILAMVGVMLAASPVRASDETDCVKGIKKLQAMKRPTAKQKAALAAAEQEQIEADWSECKQVLKK